MSPIIRFSVGHPVELANNGRLANSARAERSLFPGRCGRDERVAASWQQGLPDISWFYPRSKTSTASTVGKWRAISCQVSPSSRLAKTEPEFVPK